MHPYSTLSSAIVPEGLSPQPEGCSVPGGAAEPVLGPVIGGRLRRLEHVDLESGTPAVEWQPAETQLRIVGPGRKERALCSEISELRAGQERAERALETAQLVERGTHRYVDRVEQELDLAGAQNQRLLVALGGLQEQNQALLKELEAVRADRPRQIEAAQARQAPMAASETPKLGRRRWFKRRNRR